MVPNEEAILEIMECFTEATGIGLYCLDKTMDIQTFTTAKWTPDELECLEMGDVSWHLWKQVRSGSTVQTGQPSQPGTDYESFTTRGGFHYLIGRVPAKSRPDQPDCFLVSEPLVTRTITPDSERMAKLLCLSSRRVDQLGKALGHLCHSAGMKVPSSRLVNFKDQRATHTQELAAHAYYSESAYAFAFKMLPS